MVNGWTYNFCDPEDEWAAMKEIRELPSAQPNEQIKWERDTAIQQLADLGYGLGEKPRRDDCISRKAAVDALHTRFRDGFDGDKWWNSTHVLAAIEGLPSAEPERKTPDHGYMWICPVCGLEVHSDFRRCVRCGWDRPSAEPEWKKGRWCKAYADIELHGIRPFIRVCSSCASVSNDYYNFCPNCGARMEQEERK